MFSGTLAFLIFSAIVLPDPNQIDNHDSVMIIQKKTLGRQSDLSDNHFEDSSHVYLQVILPETKVANLRLSLLW